MVKQVQSKELKHGKNLALEELADVQAAFIADVNVR